MSAVVRLESVTKKYQLGAERSNWRSLIPGPRGERSKGSSFCALDNVDIEIPAGAAVGILGKNGSGKSTALKIMAGIVRPTSGTVRRSGSLAAVIELGVGFNPELTGEENLRFGGALLGATVRDLERNRDAIVEFAGLEGFMDMPVKRYSTGMRARLGFSMVTAFETDVLILDEVLSVGDWEFQRRCIERIREFHAGGTALVAVSHSPWLITQLCDQAYLLEHGRVAAHGDTLAIIEQYLGSETHTDPDQDESLPKLPFLHDDLSSTVHISDLVIEELRFPSNQPLRFRFTLTVEEPVDGRIILSVYTMGRAVFADPAEGPSELLSRTGTWTVRCVTAPLPFAPGPFQARVAVVRALDQEDDLQLHLAALTSEQAIFFIVGRPSSRPGFLMDTAWSVEAAEPSRSTE